MNTRLPLQVAVFAEVNDVLDVALAVVVARMRLAGENELHRPLLVAREAHDVFELLENQRRAFVGGEAARETDGQRVGIEQLIEGDEIALREALVLEQQAAAGEFDQFAAQLVAQRPEFLVADEIRVGHFLPELRRVDPAQSGPIVPKRCRRRRMERSRVARSSLRRQKRRTVPFIQPSR